MEVKMGEHLIASVFSNTCVNCEFGMVNCANYVEGACELNNCECSDLKAHECQDQECATFKECYNAFRCGFKWAEVIHLGLERHNECVIGQ